MSETRQLHVAEVTKLITCEFACKNSIVCLESEAENYGRGPDGIETGEDLADWLSRNGWRRFEIEEGTIDKWHGGDWRELYVCLPWPQSVSARIQPFEGRSVCFGPKGLHEVGTGHSNFMSITDNKASLWGVRVSAVRQVAGNIYRQAAEYAEGNLAADLDADDELRVPYLGPRLYGEWP